MTTQPQLDKSLVCAVIDILNARPVLIDRLPAPVPLTHRYARDYRSQTSCSAVMSGAVWFNAVRLKLKMSGWTIEPCRDAFRPCTCAWCGNQQLASTDWIGPNYRRDNTDDYRTFNHCPYCDRAVEDFYIRRCEPILTDRVIYLGNPLIDLKARLIYGSAP